MGFETTGGDMAVTILIPTPLRAYAHKHSSFASSAATVGQALHELTTQFAELRKHLYADDGRLRSFVNVYLNDEDVRYLQQENTPVQPGDTISIIPSIAGGIGPLRHRMISPLNQDRNALNALMP
jgi:molybdopterin converting factor small subunit